MNSPWSLIATFSGSTLVASKWNGYIRETWTVSTLRETRSRRSYVSSCLDTTLIGPFLVVWSLLTGRPRPSPIVFGYSTRTYVPTSYVVGTPERSATLCVSTSIWSLDAFARMSACISCCSSHHVRASSGVRRFSRESSKNRFILTAGPNKSSAEVNPISRCLVVLKINWTAGNARVQSFITRSSRMNARMLRSTCLFAFSTFPLCSCEWAMGVFWYLVPKVAHTFVTISFANWAPLSVRMVLGAPYRPKCSNSFIAAISAV